MSTLQTGMARRHWKRFLCCMIIALFVTGNVRSEPIPTVPGRAVTVPEQIDGLFKFTWDDATVTTNEDVIDVTTQSTGTTHDRVLFTESPVMDVITLIWYLATFFALIAFFLVMACADRHRCRSRKPATEDRTAPPTPAPSYRQFAPPTYDSLVFEKDNDSIFIIPYDSVIENGHQRNAEDLASNLEQIIEPASPRLHPSNQHTVNISDISSESDDVPVIVVEQSTARPGPDVTDRNVTEL
ncbi:uncharacterized protein LOC128725264 [Anopheles nili]|uniref:uncharacterized protein LOC128725264 n=1 Tax=Anopheles nili TaxID=185578 RepID=UPI00237B5A64|nr:uncharacterized protein LOC128725264 [Anopheles nili]